MAEARPPCDCATLLCSIVRSPSCRRRQSNPGPLAPSPHGRTRYPAELEFRSRLECSSISRQWVGVASREREPGSAHFFGYDTNRARAGRGGIFRRLEGRAMKARWTDLLALAA